MPGDVAGAAATEAVGVAPAEVVPPAGAFGSVVVVWAKRKPADAGKFAKAMETIAIRRRREARRDRAGEGRSLRVSGVSMSGLCLCVIIQY